MIDEQTVRMKKMKYVIAFGTAGPSDITYMYVPNLEKTVIERNEKGFNENKLYELIKYRSEHMWEVALDFDCEPEVLREYMKMHNIHKKGTDKMDE